MHPKTRIPAPKRANQAVSQSRAGKGIQSRQWPSETHSGRQETEQTK
ncbi:hypothetical protein ACM67C_09895 [Bergeriella denitrificans]|nr:hypothetical protein [Bergeriella denitrificans]